MTLLKIALLNVLKNRRRSLFAISAIGFEGLDFVSLKDFRSA